MLNFQWVAANFCFLTGFKDFNFLELVDATNNFSPGSKIGLGGFSIVYKVGDALFFLKKNCTAGAVWLVK